MRTILLALTFLLLVATRVAAQSTITFTASTSHSTVLSDGRPMLTSYEFRVTGPATRSTNLGKPTPDTSNVITVATLRSFFDALPYGSYTARVAAIGPGGENVSVGTAFTRSISLQPPAAPGSGPTIIDASGQPWTTQGIGGQQGEASFVSNQLLITSTGGNTWNAADSFWFVHQQESGDGEIVAQVSRVDFTHANAKGGVQFREGLTAGSRVVQLSLAPDGGVALLQRAATNGSMVTLAARPAGTATFPSWLRIRRTGTSFTAATSRDGVTWTTLGTTSVAMGPATHAGAFHMARQGTGTAAFLRLVRQ